MSADALQDVSQILDRTTGMDLYWCPHCGFVFAYRVPREDMIGHCWGECLELYGEPIPITFVRGIGPGRPGRESPF